MRKRIKTLFTALLLGAAVLGTGCVPTQQTSIERGPDFTVKENIKLDETQLYNDVLEAFGDADENPYVYVSAFDIACDNDKKLITVTATCINDTTEDEAKQFAAAAVRRIDDAAAIQSAAYEVSSQESFGNLWDTYALKLTVSTAAGTEKASASASEGASAPAEKENAAAKKESTSEMAQKEDASQPAQAEDNESAAAEGKDSAGASTDLLKLDIPAGGEIPLNPDIETYEEDWQEQRSKMLQNRVYDANGNVVSE